MKNFLKRLLSSVLDEIAILAISGILLGLGILILGVLGYTLVNTLYVGIVIVAVVYLLYYPIVGAIIGNSLGQKIVKLD